MGTSPRHGPPRQGGDARLDRPDDAVLGRAARAGGKLEKLRASPYFGRFDFRREGRNETAAYYIGIHDFREEDTQEPWVHDWRAPVSSLFYDFETGPAGYDAPSGRIDGEMTLKRQFRIREGEMEFMLDVSVNIVDDVLQETLAEASDDGMKNIVATIQRDQNAIIRDAEARHADHPGGGRIGQDLDRAAPHRVPALPVQGHAESKDILIISPNRVFADYIGNVLPELGEESVPEIGMERWPHPAGPKTRFQSFFDQTARLLEPRTGAAPNASAAKADAGVPAPDRPYARSWKRRLLRGRGRDQAQAPRAGLRVRETWRKRYKPACR